MTVVTIIKWGQPKPGYEFEYHLAWKHRAITSAMLADVTWCMFFRPFRHRRIYRMWARAVDRTKIYGQDLVC